MSTSAKDIVNEMDFLRLTLGNNKFNRKFFLYTFEFPHDEFQQKIFNSHSSAWRVHTHTNPHENQLCEVVKCHPLSPVTFQSINRSHWKCLVIPVQVFKRKTLTLCLAVDFFLFNQLFFLISFSVCVMLLFFENEKNRKKTLLRVDSINTKITTTILQALIDASHRLKTWITGKENKRFLNL